MRATRVVLPANISQFSFQVTGIPEEHLIKQFSPHGPDQSFDKGMREWCLGDGLDFVCTKYPQVRMPLVIQQ